MGLKIETWNIAYRKRKESLLFKDTNDFIMIKNDKNGWYADPFLFDYKGNTYLFAEFFSYKLGKGIIRYSVFDKEKNEFSEFRTIIEEDFHLSYPCVFKQNGEIYMLPEAGESESLYLYKAIKFPDRWEKMPCLMDKIRLADTTPFFVNGNMYAYTLVQDKNSADGEMNILKFEDDKAMLIFEHGISNDMTKARCGGNCFEHNGKMYRVAQDCSQDYGKALSLYSFNNDFSEKLENRVEECDVSLINAVKPQGIHTYNFSKEFEVIDVKFYRNQYYRFFLNSLKRFLNKYRWWKK